MQNEKLKTKNQSYALPHSFIFALNELVRQKLFENKSKLMRNLFGKWITEEKRLISILEILTKNHKIPSDHSTCPFTANISETDIEEIDWIVKEKGSVPSIAEFIRLAIRDYFKEFVKLNQENFKELLEICEKDKENKSIEKTIYKKDMRKKCHSMSLPYLFVLSLQELKKYRIIKNSSDIIKKSIHKYILKEKRLIELLDHLGKKSEETRSIHKERVKAVSSNLFEFEIKELKEFIIGKKKSVTSIGEFMRIGLREFFFSLIDSGIFNIIIPDLKGFEIVEKEPTEIKEGVEIVKIPIEIEDGKRTYKEYKILRKLN